MRSQVRQIYLKEPDFRIYELIIPSAVDSWHIYGIKF